MGQLSERIFEWDQEDMAALRRAIEEPTKKEKLRHCRRSRGTEDTLRLLNELVDVYSTDQGRDVLGVPLFNIEWLVNTWKIQQHHGPCLQDPEGYPLYRQIGTVLKGGH